MPVVYLDSDETISCESATVTVSGWVSCRLEDGHYESYPPHRIQRIWDDGEGKRGERLRHESPHGSV